MSGWNMPLGTYEGDPRAPWNQPDGYDEEDFEYDADGYDDGGHFDPTRVRRIYAELMDRARGDGSAPSTETEGR